MVRRKGSHLRSQRPTALLDVNNKRGRLITGIYVHKPKMHINVNGSDIRCNWKYFSAFSINPAFRPNGYYVAMILSAMPQM